MNHFNNHNIMSNTGGLDLFAWICGVVSGVASMLHVHPFVTSSLGGSMLIAFIMGGAGWLGGFAAKEVAKHVKIQWKNFKNK